MKKEKIQKTTKKLKDIEQKGKKKAKGFVKEFKEFATKGNVIDMSIGVIVGSAFTKIVNSLVNDVITPLLSIFTGKLDFTNLFIALDGNTYESIAQAQAAGTTVVNYGQFITNIFNFITVALCLFIFLKILFKFRTKKEEAPAKPTTKKCPYCLNEIPLEATRCGHCTSEQPIEE